MKSKILVLLVAAILALPAGHSLSGGQQPFSITLATKHEVVKVGEDILLEITLTNTSQSEIRLAEAPGDPPPAEFQYLIEVHDDKGEPAPDSEYGRRLKANPNPRGSRVTRALAPGESLKDETTLTRVFNLSRPDKYIVQASRKIPDYLGKGVVKSNTITITVTE